MEIQLNKLFSVSGWPAAVRVALLMTFRTPRDAEQCPHVQISREELRTLRSRYKDLRKVSGQLTQDATRGEVQAAFDKALPAALRWVADRAKPRGPRHE